MNKNELIKLAAFKSGLSYKEQQKAIEALLCTIGDVLHEGKEVVIPDFGKFCVKDCAQHRVRHPKSGEVITIPPTTRVRFKPFGNIVNYSLKYGN